MNKLKLSLPNLPQDLNTIMNDMYLTLKYNFLMEPATAILFKNCLFSWNIKWFIHLPELMQSLKNKSPLMAIATDGGPMI